MFMLNEKDRNEFIIWLRDKGRIKLEPTDVLINENGNVKLEKRMVEIVNVTPDDWKEFCKETGREYKGEVCLAVK